ncbi:cell division protein FtsA [Lysinibacillus sp. 2017]|uniref:cell division protein FtsA n=1 Tax=unclassified Lysinibacillus TaxID=2636778 RepID=UPI000D529870|nr:MULTISPECIES: cell division protein FtsA [unclassified Lysinibacillus]AWE06586.1 cell division protein FtsA [Lysinibacillus sp. 2017]TGN35377.1 cell division protein FtsA [Lysinibacillus sp. S2017]
MNHQEIYVSLDIGSSSIKVLIGEMGDDQLHVIGVGHVKSTGIRKGAIVDIDATVQSIKKAVEQAERMTGIKIEEVVLGVPANQTFLQPVKGVVAVNGEDREITDDDLARVIDSAQVMSIPPERELVNLIPKQFIVDNLDEIKDPRGMIGIRLEMDATMITTSKTLVHNVLRCVERAGLQIREIYLQPLAAGQFALTEDEKNQGTAYIDLGGGSTTVAVFQDGLLTHTAVIPVGGDHITKDLSIVLKTPTEQAEKIKKQYGHAFYDDASDEQLFEVPVVGTDSTDQYSQRYIAEIIGVRLEELFELVLDELARMGIQDLPGGIVISGGVAQLEGLAQLARQVMLSRVRIYTPDYIGVREPAFTTSVGLIHYANADDDFYGRSEPSTVASYAPYPAQQAPSKKQANAPERVDSGNKVSVIDRAKNLLNKFFD